MTVATLKTVSSAPAAVRRWQDILDQLFDQVQRWSEDDQWEVARRSKNLQESDLGSYRAPTLKLNTPDGIFVLEPTARKLVHGEGRVELYAWPSMSRAFIIRHGDKWRLYDDAGKSRQWSQKAFRGVLAELAGH